MYSGILPIIKQAAVDAVDATQPVSILFGKVTSTSPLKIQVTPKLTLGEGNLVVCSSLRKFTVDFTVKGNTGYGNEHRHSVSLSTSDGTVSGNTGSVDEHRHSVSIPTTVTFDNSLKTGDSVVLLRIQGGNKYLVVDKAVNS